MLDCVGCCDDDSPCDRLRVSDSDAVGPPDGEGCWLRDAACEDESVADVVWAWDGERDCDRVGCVVAEVVCDGVTDPERVIAAELVTVALRVAS